MESGALKDAGDRYVAVGSLQAASRSHSIPGTLLGSLSARLDRLGPTREIAQIASAIGRKFSYDLIASVAPFSGSHLESALERLSISGIIFARGQPPDSAYIFKHALIQDAAYASMVRSKRQQLHGRIADALIGRFPEIVETQPELIAHHLEQAGLTERAIEYLRKAGRRAIEHSANSEAVHHLTRALGLLQSLPRSPERRRATLALEVLLGQAMITLHGYAAPKTAEVLLRAKTYIDSAPTQKFGILYGIWACHYVAGEVAKQRDLAAEFLAEAERCKDTAALCIGHRILGTTYVTMGDFATGRRHLQRARALFDAEHHSRCRFQYGQDIGAAALCYLSWALWQLGCVDQASEVANDAVKRAEELSHPHTLVYTICHVRGFMDLFRRRSEGMESYADRVVSTCTENGFAHWANCGRIFEGWARICDGDAQQGIEKLRAGVLDWQSRGARLWLPMFSGLQAQACAKAGLSDAALRAVEEALAISDRTGERWSVAELLRIKADLLLAFGRAGAQEIEAILVNSLEIARRQQALSWELRAACDLARLWQSQRRGKEALQLLQPVYDQFTEGFATADLRDAEALIRSLRRNSGCKVASGPRSDRKATSLHSSGRCGRFSG
jgi:predicted ATPase